MPSQLPDGTNLIGLTRREAEVDGQKREVLSGWARRLARNGTLEDEGKVLRVQFLQFHEELIHMYMMHMPCIDGCITLQVHPEYNCTQCTEYSVCMYREFRTADA